MNSFSLPVIINCGEEELEVAGSFFFVLNNFIVLEDLFGQCVLFKVLAFMAEILSPLRKSQGLEGSILQT